MTYSRSSFLKLLGLGGLAVSGNLLHASPFKDSDQTQYPNKSSSNLTLGLATYSTREYSLDETLKMAERLGITKLAIKSMHLPLESTKGEIETALEKVKAAGLTIYGAGVIYMKTAEEVENAFRYAKTAKLKMIIGVPNHDLLQLVEMKVKETDIKLAIHNHGPGDEVYPTPEVVYTKIKSLDPRIGLCIDIGHVMRLGLNPVENITKYADRLYDLHLKDVDKIAAEGKSVELGTGLIDIPAIMKTLKEINYEGVMALEYEKDGNDVLPGLSQCVGYANGVIDSL